MYKNVINNEIFYIPNYVVVKAIGLYILSLLICSLIFFDKILPSIWVVYGLVTVILFFVISNYLVKKWAILKIERMYAIVFMYSLIIRLFWIIYSYYFYSKMTGKPFEFYATDVIWFHERAKSIIENPVNYLKIATPSNAGYTIYLSYLYKWFGVSIIIPRIVKAIISSFMVILIMKITYRNFGIKAAKIAGVLSMLIPNFVYYTGLHLRETEMVFLVVIFIDRVDYLFRYNKFIVINFIIIVLVIVLLFYTRTVIGLIAIITVATVSLFTATRISNILIKSIALLFMILLTYILLSSSFSYDVDYYWKGRKTNQELSFAESAQRVDGNIYYKYATTITVAPFILPGPYPTLVNIANQENTLLLNGVYFIRNILSFFVFVSIYLMYKRKEIFKHIVLVIFFLGYLTILGLSGFALSERFHMPILPIILIFASDGITKMNMIKRKYFNFYLTVIFIIILAWNYFKLDGRGIL